MLHYFLALLLYPGLAFALVLALLYRALVGVRYGGRATPAASWGQREGVLNLVSIALTGLGLTLLPWPLHPAPAATRWVWAWLAFGLAHLLALMPGLLATNPPIVRATLREAQIGILGQALLWMVIAVGLTLQHTWQPLAIAVHLLALGAGLLAWPAAAGWGPFAAEISLHTDGAEQGLTTDLRALAEFARNLRAAALLAALLLATLPTGIAQAPLALAMVAAGFIIVALVLRRMAGQGPRLTLPAALRVCLLWAGSLALAATVALAFVGS